ncbi:MAG TPA: cysteine--tRNA ligase [Cyanobacteria bacterium UBA8530]|nr:cysteine--tRNA ligase [Cyanobacteria bacterium UBA8530]
MILLFNTMSRSKEEFIPLVPGKVGMYTCGPTVYNFAHIGNLRAYVFADTLKRVLLDDGFEVKHVMNITDVGHLTDDADAGDDKMEAGAARERKSVWEIARFYEQAFKEDLELLNILSPTLFCRATEHIQEQIELIKRLEEKGFTYTIEDGVYLDTSKIEDYGKLARLDIDKLLAGARVAMAEGKKSPTDFALWKFSPKTKKRAMEWDSPWGPGFPGWHIECSAMGMKHLGETFDIHTGGIDHIPVHHTNEIAQSEAATGKVFVRYWLHNDFLVLEAAKMSKSSGEFLTLRKLIEMGYQPVDYRYFLLNSLYRRPATFTFEALDGARSAVSNLRDRVLSLREAKGSKNPQKAEEYLSQFRSAVRDDLNTPQGLAVLWNSLKDDELGPDEKNYLLGQFDAVLGLGMDRFEKKEEFIPEEVFALVEARQTARKNREFAEADSIRVRIQGLGFLVEDTAQGPQVRKA